jgi:hypothetical protein
LTTFSLVEFGGCLQVVAAETVVRPTFHGDIADVFNKTRLFSYAAQNGGKRSAGPGEDKMITSMTIIDNAKDGGQDHVNALVINNRKWSVAKVKTPNFTTAIDFVVKSPPPVCQKTIFAFIRPFPSHFICNFFCRISLRCQKFVQSAPGRQPAIKQSSLRLPTLHYPLDPHLHDLH